MTENLGDLRIVSHPILGDLSRQQIVSIVFDGQPLSAIAGEPILAALAAHGVRRSRTTAVRHEPRWCYCGIGRCTDCMMIVDGVPNIRTCVTPVSDKMRVETQYAVGKWGAKGD